MKGIFMKLGRLALLTIALTAFTGPAYAQMVVMGKSKAAQCYEYALAGNSGTRSAINTCTEAFDDVLSQRNRAATHVNRGVLFMRQGAQLKATSDYEAALAIKPNLTQAYVNHAASLIRQERYDEAIESLNTALSDTESPTRAAALYNRAIAFDAKKDYKGAYFDLKAALAIRPDWELALGMISRYEVQSASTG